jgi:hypothetical protein
VVVLDARFMDPENEEHWGTLLACLQDAELQSFLKPAVASLVRTVALGSEDAGEADAELKTLLRLVAGQGTSPILSAPPSPRDGSLTPFKALLGPPTPVEFYLTHLAEALAIRIPYSSWEVTGANVICQSSGYCYWVTLSSLHRTYCLEGLRTAVYELPSGYGC